MMQVLILVPGKTIWENLNPSSGPPASPKKKVGESLLLPASTKANYLINNS